MSETADYVDQQYKKNHFSKDYFKDATVDLSEIENAVPSEVKTRGCRWESPRAGSRRESGHRLAPRPRRRAGAAEGAATRAVDRKSVV